MYKIVTLVSIVIAAETRQFGCKCCGGHVRIACNT